METPNDVARVVDAQSYGVRSTIRSAEIDVGTVIPESHMELEPRKHFDLRFADDLTKVVNSVGFPNGIDTAEVAKTGPSAVIVEIWLRVKTILQDAGVYRDLSSIVDSRR